MRGVLTEGDLLSAEVQALAAADQSIALHTRSAKYGKVRVRAVCRIGISYLSCSA